MSVSSRRPRRVGRSGNRTVDGPPIVEDENIGMQSANARIEAANAARVLHGRRWLGALLWLFASLCIVLAASTVLLGWSAVLFIGIPVLIAAFVCLTYGWGEVIALVELCNDGFSLRLPSYRGYFPFWPARRLKGEWTEVTAIRRCHVEAKYFGIRYDYIAHWIVTQRGSILLLEPLPNDLSRDSRKSSFNLPVRMITEEFAQHAELAPHDCGRVHGGGLWRNLFFGGSILLRAAIFQQRPIDE